MRKLISFCSYFWNNLEDVTKIVLGCLLLCILAIPKAIYSFDGNTPWYTVYGETILILICGAIVVAVALGVLLFIVSIIEDIVLSFRCAVDTVSKHPKIRNAKLRQVINVISQVDRDTDVLPYIMDNWAELMHTGVKTAHLACNKRITISVMEDSWSVIVMDKSTGKSYYYDHEGTNGVY